VKLWKGAAAKMVAQVIFWVRESDAGMTVKRV
jgi:hypothetical protein